MGFLKCACYLALIGVLAFLAGRIVPKRWFHAELFPYRPLPFEDEGRFYNRFKIRAWQNKVPDMSKIFPGLLPPKSLSGNFKERLPLMLQETCVAELTHALLCLAGLYCIALWPGAGGAVIAVLNVFLFNMPFILIQRYNRPRLMKLYQGLREPRGAKPILT